MHHDFLTPGAKLAKAFGLLARIAATERFPYCATTSEEVDQIRAYVAAGLVVAEFAETASWLPVGCAAVSALTPEGRTAARSIPFRR
ncbi:hypothetical protein GT347_20405 [Xylophilus rhododendri]|uniref:Uncharacterized protein n=1 Tax=Xylophilus rhododendri TaxID=2697032 RepID=A0A857J835_9BURK|nr:hypothetical protein [Xylophilus rhododendri]QHJ00135.1 hypothetical protein GT347_20405 [Xylophilus rhododendri]